MGQFYVAESGGTKAASEDTPGSPMSITSFNAATFTDDDIINQTAAINTTMTPKGAGSEGSEIVLNLLGEDAFVIDDGEDQALFITGVVDWWIVNDPGGTGASDSDKAFISCTGVSGTENGTSGTTITNIINRCRILSSNDDGISVADTAKVLYNDPFIRNCFDAASPGDGGIQAITAHSNSVIIVNNPDVDVVSSWITPTENARIIINGGRLKGAMNATVNMGGDCTALCRIIINDVELINDGATVDETDFTAPSPVGMGAQSGAASILIIGGSWTGTGINTKTAVNQNTITWLNVTFNLTDPLYATQTNTRTLISDSGTDDTSVNAATMTDTGAAFTVNEHVDKIIRNLTNGSEGLITANTATIVTAKMEHGLTNVWNSGDAYSIIVRGTTNIIGCNYGDYVGEGGFSVINDNESGVLNFISNSIDSVDAEDSTFLAFQTDDINTSGSVIGNYIGELIDLSSNGFLLVNNTVSGFGKVDVNYNTWGAENQSAALAINCLDGEVNEFIGNTFFNIPNVYTGLTAKVAVAYGNNSVNSEAGLVGSVTLDPAEIDIPRFIAAAKGEVAVASSTGLTSGITGLT